MITNACDVPGSLIYIRAHLLLTIFFLSLPNMAVPSFNPPRLLICCCSIITPVHALPHHKITLSLMHISNHHSQWLNIPPLYFSLLSLLVYSCPEYTLFHVFPYHTSPISLMLLPCPASFLDLYLFSPTVFLTYFTA